MRQFAKSYLRNTSGVTRKD